MSTDIDTMVATYEAARLYYWQLRRARAALSAASNTAHINGFPEVKQTIELAAIVEARRCAQAHLDALHRQYISLSRVCGVALGTQLEKTVPAASDKLEELSLTHVPQ